MNDECEHCNHYSRSMTMCTVCQIINENFDDFWFQAFKISEKFRIYNQLLKRDNLVKYVDTKESIVL